MNILFTLCARAGSKGIKNKNLRSFCGFPLLYYSLSVIDMFNNTAKGQSFDKNTAVDSDSKKLLQLAEENPFFKIDTIERRIELSGDLVGKMDVIKDCMDIMEQRKGKSYDVVIDLDLTSPLRRLEDLNTLIDVHFNSGADVTTSVTNSRRNPYFNMVKKTDHGYKKVLDADFVSRQQAPLVYDMNASLYAYKPDFLRSGKRMFEGYCECIHMYDTGILDLDGENDLELMQVIAGHLYETRKDFSLVRENIVGKSHEMQINKL